VLGVRVVSKLQDADENWQATGHFKELHQRSPARTGDLHTAQCGSGLRRAKQGQMPLRSVAGVSVAAV
jgi:hypothetical protein